MCLWILCVRVRFFQPLPFFSRTISISNDQTLILDIIGRRSIRRKKWGLKIMSSAGKQSRIVLLMVSEWINTWLLIWFDTHTRPMGIIYDVCCNTSYQSIFLAHAQEYLLLWLKQSAWPVHRTVIRSWGSTAKLIKKFYLNKLAAFHAQISDEWFNF